MTSATKTKLVNAFAAPKGRAAIDKNPRRELLADDVQLEIPLLRCLPLRTYTRPATNGALASIR